MALIRVEANRFHSWNMDQMFFGGPENGYQVWPNPDDMVVDWTTGIWRVIRVGPTGIPELKLYLRFNTDPSATPNSDNLITAISEYQTSIATPIYYDASRDPQELIIDPAYPILESDIVKFSLFKGTDTSIDGEIISHKFSGSTITGVLFDCNLVTGLPTIKRPEIVTTRSLLTAGDQVTGVFYDASNRAIGEKRFTLYESATSRPLDSTDKTIVDISLKSDLLDITDPLIINNDLNVDHIDSLTVAYLHYNDGTRTEVPIDNTKMKLLNATEHQFNSLIRATDVTLVYYPDADEPYVNASGTMRASLKKQYKLRNIQGPNTYALKLYCIPKFIDVSTGYELSWRLCNLDRDVDLDVTSDVIVRKVGGYLFEPTNYGEKQELDVTLEMDKVAPGSYPGFIFTNRVNITVEIPHILGKSPWSIDYNTDGNNVFGVGMEAAIGPGKGNPIPVIDAYDTIWFGIGLFGDSDAWLQALYNTIEPVFDTTAMTEPADPTHFKFEYEGTVSPVYPLSAWADELPAPAGISAFEKTKTVNIVWLLDSGTGYGVLGHSPLITNDTLK